MAQVFLNSVNVALITTTFSIISFSFVTMVTTSMDVEITYGYQLLYDIILSNDETYVK